MHTPTPPRPPSRDMQVQTAAPAGRAGLTFRSLWTTPIWWQWSTASRICWMQWLWQTACALVPWPVGCVAWGWVPSLAEPKGGRESRRRLPHGNRLWPGAPLIPGQHGHG